MNQCPFDVTKELAGWTLYWAHLESRSGHDESLARLRETAADQVRRTLNLKELSTHATIAALRTLFKQAGTDPSRYRPASSEALIRRILKGVEIPSIHPLVDLNNCLSASLAVPCCVMREGSFSPPLVWRAGSKGESYESLKGRFNLEGKPLLVDSVGPVDAPITGSQRVKVTPTTERVWLVAYLPSDVVSARHVDDTLHSLLDQAPIARLLNSAAS
jgi:DNA/RNA-binding domain of Phe-tRNA-synthetase-like protein